MANIPEWGTLPCMGMFYAAGWARGGAMAAKLLPFMPIYGCSVCSGQKNPPAKGEKLGGEMP